MDGIFLMSCWSLARLYGKKEYHATALKYKLRCIEILRQEFDMEQTVSDATVARVLFLASDEFHIWKDGGHTQPYEGYWEVDTHEGRIRASGP